MTELSTPTLFSPITLRSTNFANRVWMPPMCQYSASDGVVNDWHLIHYGERATGGFGLIIAEATGVVPEGRITPHCAGLWNDEQVVAWRRVTDAVHSRGTLIGVQLQHAGRKASSYRPFGTGSGSVPAAEGGWTTVAPSAITIPRYAEPVAMTAEQIRAIPQAFADAAVRAEAAGFDVVELHGAHGYLLHQFLSPLSNDRTDEWGGSLENRARLLLETVDAVRAAWPTKPLLVRVSATDWLDGGLTLEESGIVGAWMRERGVDLINVSTGGLVKAPVPVGPCYQVPAARAVKLASGLPVAAVGLIATAAEAEQVVVEGSADVVMIGRPALFDPHWPLRAAAALGLETPVLPTDDADQVSVVGLATGWTPQYARGIWG